MEPSTFGRLPYEKLVSYTDNFSESNCIGDFQFGKLYRAKTNSHDNPYHLLVKKWEVPSHRDNEVRLMKEAILLRHEMLINHPGMAPLYGYHWEGQNLVAIYDFKPFDSLFNLIPKDDFTWIQRIKAALGLASLLKFLHARRKATCKPFIVQNLEAAHVVLDEDYNPKLCDFGSMTGGIFTGGRNASANDDIGCCGCINTGQDVFAFGVILLSLISKRAYTEEDLLAGVIQFFYEQALRESGAFDMKTIASSFVHKSFAGTHGFHCADGHKITELALECVNTDESQRPTMKQVCRFLLRKLEVVKQHADFLGVRKDDQRNEKGLTSSYRTNEDKDQRNEKGLTSSYRTNEDKFTRMELGNFVRLSYEQLVAYTDNFSENNYISHFQFGKLYHGKIVQAEQTQYVMVKVWEILEIYEHRPKDNQKRLMDEVMLLSHEIFNNHPGMLKLYGYCYEEDDRMGVVCDFKPFDSVFNLIPKDGFSWLQRIKVALGFASLLKFLHTKDPFFKPFIVRNLDCAHIVLDEDYNPKLCDFGLITGGIFPDRTIYKAHYILGSIGYIDVDAFYSDEFTDKQDVFAFGVILVNLISKRVYDVENRRETAPAIYEWAYREYAPYYEDLFEDEPNSDSKKPKFSLVHQSLTSDPDFDPIDGHKISELTNNCLDGCSQRPTMKQVVRSLLKLKVVKKHADSLQVKKLLSYRPLH